MGLKEGAVQTLLRSGNSYIFPRGWDEPAHENSDDHGCDEDFADNVHR